VLRVVGLQTLNPPQGVVPLRLGITVGLLHQNFAFTQKAPQASVDEATLGLRLALLTGRVNGLVDQGVHWVRRITVAPTQGQGGAQQGVDRRGRFFGGQPLAQSRGPAQLAHHLETQRLHARAQWGGHGVQLSRQ
jgi:hypothetical protein